MLLKSLGMILMLLCCVTACSPSNDGLFELPVRHVELTEVITPSSPLVSAELSEFTASWQHGRPVFEVTWLFDGGVTPLVSVEQTADSYHTINIVTDSDVQEPVEYGGQVYVEDHHGNTSLLSFSYTVVPAG